MAGWQPPATDAVVGTPPAAWAPPDADLAPQGGLQVLTDDGDTSWLNNQPAQSTHIPGLIERAGNAIAHPIQAIQDAWNYPGSYVADAAKNMAASAKSAATLPGDVATGKVDMNDPAQARSNAARVLTAAMLASPVSPASIRTGVPISPPTDDIYAAGSRGFDNWRANGDARDPSDLAEWARRQQGALNADGILPVQAGAPSTHDILAQAANPPAGALPVDPGSLDALRKAFVNTAHGAGANNTERMAANRARDSYMDWLSQAPSEAIGATSPPSVQGLRDAIGNWAAASRSDLVNNLESNAELQAERSHSGHANGNPIRQNVASVLRVNPSTGQSLASRSGLNDEEQDALRNVVGSGGPVRTLGNMAGGGLGHGGFIGALLGAREGYEAGGVPGAMVGGSIPFIGSGLKALDKAAAARRLADADNLIRSRSPLAQQMSTPGAAIFPTSQNRLVRALMAQQGQPQDQSQP